MFQKCEYKQYPNTVLLNSVKKRQERQEASGGRQEASGGRQEASGDIGKRHEEHRSVMRCQTTSKGTIKRQRTIDT